jgi:hypothetical protein
MIPLEKGLYATPFICLLIFSQHGWLYNKLIWFAWGGGFIVLWQKRWQREMQNCNKMRIHCLQFQHFLIFYFVLKVHAPAFSNLMYKTSRRLKMWDPEILNPGPFLNNNLLNCTQISRKPSNILINLTDYEIQKYVTTI